MVSGSVLMYLFGVESKVCVSPVSNRQLIYLWYLVEGFCIFMMSGSIFGNLYGVWWKVDVSVVVFGGS